MFNSLHLLRGLHNLLAAKREGWIEKQTCLTVGSNLLWWTWLPRLIGSTESLLRSLLLGVATDIARTTDKTNETRLQDADSRSLAYPLVHLLEFYPRSECHRSRFLIQLPLVLFQGQHIIGPTVYNPLGDVLKRSHGVKRCAPAIGLAPLLDLPRSNPH